MYQKIVMAVECVVIGFLFILLMICLYMPVRMNVLVANKLIYSGLNISSDDLYIEHVSLLGNKSSPEKTSVFNVSDSLIQVQTDKFSQKFVVNKVPIKDLEINYNGTIYQYSTLQKSKIEIKRSYVDGTSNYVKDFEIDTREPVVNKTNLPIQVGTSQYDFQVDPVKVDHIVAKYNAPIHKGDKFDLNNVSVTLLYEDGHEFQLDKFTTDFSGYINENMTIQLNLNQYGTCDLPLRFEEPLNVSISYAGSIYEGIPIDKDLFKIVLEFASEDYPVYVRDITLSEDTIYEPTKLTLTSLLYGDFDYDVEPVKIDTFDVRMNEGETGKTVRDLEVRYTDGYNLYVEPEDFVLNTPIEEVVPGATVFITWNGKDYSFVYRPNEVVAEPETDAPEPESETEYNYEPPEDDGIIISPLE